jgi:membrane protease subunit HflC
MKSISIILIAIIIVAAIMMPQIFYAVDETEVAVVTRLGQITAVKKSSGLNVKAPFIDTITRYEKRLLLFDAPPDSLLTKDKKRLIIDMYARGKITDPGQFREKFVDEVDATNKAVDIISSELRREISSHDQSEIITTKRDELMGNVLTASIPKLKEFGIELIDVRIKRADFPGEIAESVYSRMKAERQRKADKERAEGAEIDSQVRADVDRKATIIRATANRDSSIIRGCGEADATRIFAQALEQDPEFYSFQRSLESSSKILGSGTTVVMPVENFALLFEQIRAGVDQATEIKSGGVGTKAGPKRVEEDMIGAKCAQVSAQWSLAAHLKVDQPDITFLSIESAMWPDSTLGCSEDADESSGKVPGFNVTFSHSGNSYQVRANKYGSLVKIC